MTKAQLDTIGNLCLQLGKTWEVGDAQAMCDAIPDEAADHMITELRGRLAEHE